MALDDGVDDLLAAALWNLLAADDDLVAALGEYQSGPAVFASRPVPEDAPKPYIVIGAVSEDLRTATLSEPFVVRDVERDLYLFAEADGAERPVRAIAERIAGLIDNALPTITGYRRCRLLVTRGPIDLPVDPSMQARAVTVRAHLIR
jgi:hypothetical protein